MVSRSGGPTSGGSGAAGASGAPIDAPESVAARPEGGAAAGPTGAATPTAAAPPAVAPLVAVSLARALPAWGRSAPPGPPPPPRPPPPGLAPEPIRPGLRLGTANRVRARLDVLERRLVDARSHLLQTHLADRHFRAACEDRAGLVEVARPPVLLGRLEAQDGSPGLDHAGGLDPAALFGVVPL